MALETGTYIGALVVTNPTGADPKSQGDDHIRLLKSTVTNSFPGFTGPVLTTGTEAQGATVNDYVVTLSPAPAALVTGMSVRFSATHTNTSASTLQINALTAKNLLDIDGNTLAAGEVKSGAVVEAFYNGTSFYILSGNDRSHRAGDTYVGAHDFTGATITVPTASPGDADTSAASTGFVDASFGKIAGQAWTGTHTFPTQSPGDNSTKAATTAFATQLAFAAALPAQTVPALLYTNGSIASWRTTFVGDSGSGGQLGPVPAPASGDAAKYLRGDATWHLAPSCPDVIVQDQKASGTTGDTLSSIAWNVRTLNTVVRNSGSVGTLSSNTLTLPAGTWMLRAKATSTGGGSSEVHVRSRIRNTTDSTTVAASENATVIGNTSGASVQCGAPQEALGIVTIAGAKDFQVQTYAGATGLGGQALTSGDVEVYVTLEATKLS